VKKFILVIIVVSTALLASKQSTADGGPVPILILGAFAFLFALAFINPPSRRNVTQKEKQVSLMHSLGIELPPDNELDPEDESPDEER